jgi:hypothetical protein
MEVEREEEVVEDEAEDCLLATYLDGSDVQLSAAQDKP